MATTPLERQRKLFEDRERLILKTREMRDRGMLQIQIAEELGIAQTTVWKYLRMTGLRRERRQKAS